MMVITIFILCSLFVIARSYTTTFMIIGDWGGKILDKNSDYEKANHYDMFKTGIAVQMEKVYTEHLKNPQVDDFFVVTTGDNFYANGVKTTYDGQWASSYLIPFALVTCPWHPVLGNHDWQGNVEAQVMYNSDAFWQMDSLYYTKMKGDDIQFFFIDTQLLCPKYSKRNVGRKPQGPFLEDNAEKQFLWLESELFKSKAKWRFVVGHYPIVSAGTYKKVPEMQRVNDLLKLYEVDAYFCGHDHNLQHLYNKETTLYHHFVSGSGGGASHELYPVTMIPDLSLFGAEKAGFAVTTVTETHMTLNLFSWLGVELYSVTIESQVRDGVEK